IYLEEKDTAKALTYVELGRQAFEENTSLLGEEIKIYSAQGKIDVLITKFSDAIAINEDNEQLFYNRATLYESKKDHEHAEADYKRALEIRDSYFDANYGLGILYFNVAAEKSNAANDIKDFNKYEAAKKEFNEKFKQSEPYLLKAIDLNPRKTEEEQQLYRATLNSLKQLYARVGEMENYNKIKGKMDQKN